MSLGFYSYLASACGFGFLAVLLLFSWRSNLQGKLLTIVVITSAIWAGLAATLANNILYQAFEILRYLAWYVFLLELLSSAATVNAGYRKFVGWALPLCTGFAVLLLAGELYSAYKLTALEVQEHVAPFIIGHLLLALFGLAIIEQLFRNTAISYHWAIKYLFIGAGAIFAFDFFMYADALLFRHIDPDIWEARGLANLAIVPLLAIAIARNRDWSTNFFVSRDIVLNSTTLILGGLYLLVMAGGGYYLRDYGGSWGRVAQIVFLALAIVFLTAVLFSGQLRAHLRVFLGKHFYSNKYDYRKEWLQLTGELNESGREENEQEWVIRGLARIVDARGGLLWLHEEGSGYANVAAWNLERTDEVESSGGCLVSFLEERGYVINLEDLDTHPDEYEGLNPPEWLMRIGRAWLVVPLFRLDSLLGFVVLANPLIKRAINWEDRDLLKTAAKQIASHLAVLMTSSALAEARQFEVFNRLSAYMVHDLKNIAAELELVARNAEKHGHNPEFLEDAFGTVASASGEIRRLLELLRNKKADLEKNVIVDLAPLLKEVIDKHQDQLPQPRLTVDRIDGRVVAVKARLARVLAHLIDNAQQATTQDGQVEVRLHGRDGFCIVEVSDTGCGMDENFIKNRLFRPFDTTKGNAGMGIGMYESRELIRELGGEVRVESKSGEGTLISLLIPSAPMD